MNDLSSAFERKQHHSVRARVELSTFETFTSFLFRFPQRHQTSYCLPNLDDTRGHDPGLTCTVHVFAVMFPRLHSDVKSLRSVRVSCRCISSQQMIILTISPFQLFKL